MEDCIFCKISSKELDSKIVYENDFVTAFADLDPKAPVHILVIPKKHIGNFNELKRGDEKLIADLMLACKEIAKNVGIDESGYRIVINCGKDGGQLIGHLHIHLLGKRSMKWPPG